jgi:AraC family transcriptional regulator, regulatory protein of adaptative response / DNA-3-methyladenine glycosylase II
MELDPRICSQARLSRDPRFDGRFFIGVKTTRIYCRPTCPVRTVKEQNVRYFPTAAAAAESGFRPCLRCRPESSPGTPAWLGTATTVSRALRLISEHALDDGGVAALAARLGVGSRQLRRLFVQHLGASPTAVAKTLRLQFAKKLIDETNLSMSEIAFAAGFGSVRRFNAAFRKTYKRTPSKMRRLARFVSTRPEEYLFRLHFRPPFQWNALLGFFARRAMPGVEVVESGRYRRTISLKGDSGTIDVGLSKNGELLEARISFPEPSWLVLIVERLRHLFDLAADPADIASCLSQDPMLDELIETMPGLRVPGCWEGFDLAVRAILGQQVSEADANIVVGRLVRTFGKPLNTAPPLTHLFPCAEVLAKADVACIGVPKARAETIRSLARSVTEGQIDFGSVVDFEGFKALLSAVPGIGKWTAEYIAMRALGDPDAFPASDLRLLRAASLPSERSLSQRAEAWRPWRAYAAMYLWQSEGAARRQKSPTSRNRALSRAAVAMR